MFSDFLRLGHQHSHGWVIEQTPTASGHVDKHTAAQIMQQKNHPAGEYLPAPSVSHPTTAVTSCYRLLAA
jgi:hypothetical protein